jgi:hypothetical protein
MLDNFCNLAVVAQSPGPGEDECYGDVTPTGSARWALNIALRLCVPLELLAANPLAVCAVQVLRSSGQETASDCQTMWRTTMPLQQSRRTAVLSQTEGRAYPGTDYTEELSTISTVLGRAVAKGEAQL